VQGRPRQTGGCLGGCWRARHACAAQSQSPRPAGQRRASRLQRRLARAAAAPPWGCWMTASAWGEPPAAAGRAATTGALRRLMRWPRAASGPPSSAVVARRLLRARLACCWRRCGQAVGACGACAARRNPRRWQGVQGGTRSGGERHPPLTPGPMRCEGRLQRGGWLGCQLRRPPPPPRHCQPRHRGCCGRASGARRAERSQPQPPCRPPRPLPQFRR
jgi:hypothetical protein